MSIFDIERKEIGTLKEPLFRKVIDNIIHYYQNNDSKYFSGNMVEYFQYFYTDTLNDIFNTCPNIQNSPLKIKFYYQEKATYFYTTYYLHYSPDNTSDFCLNLQNYTEKKINDEYSLINKIELCLFGKTIEFEERVYQDGRKFLFWDETHGLENQREKELIFRFVDQLRILIRHYDEPVHYLNEYRYNANMIALFNHYEFINLQYNQYLCNSYYQDLLVTMNRFVLTVLDAMVNHQQSVKMKYHIPDDPLETTRNEFNLLLDTDAFGGNIKENQSIKVISDDEEDTFTVLYSDSKDSFSVEKTEDSIYVKKYGSEVVGTIPVCELNNGYIQQYHQLLRKALFRIMTGFDPISGEY